MINIFACPEELSKLQPIFAIVSDVISIIKIGVPILLIVFGMVDFGKAIVGKDDGEIKKSQGIFIKRLISAVAVFLIITIVSLVFNIVGRYVQDDAIDSWMDCLYQESNGGDSGGGNVQNKPGSNINQNYEQTQ